MSEIIVYTDGGSRGNGSLDSIGGWGALLQYGEIKKELYGGEKGASNNQMELTGVIKALEAVHTRDTPIRIYADSAYVVNGINQWVAGWKKKGWRKADKKPILNLDLWKRLDELVSLQSDIEILKIKGHAGHEGNERADALANLGMDEVI